MKWIWLLPLGESKIASGDAGSPPPSPRGLGEGEIMEITIKIIQIHDTENDRQLGPYTCSNY